MTDPASLFLIAPEDSVAVALVPLAAGASVVVDGKSLAVSADIPAGH